MKTTRQLLCALFSSTVLASPVQVEVNVHVETEHSITAGVKDSPICQLATSTSSSGLPKVTLGYEIHQASPLKVLSTHIT